MKTYSVIASNREEAERRARMIRSDYTLQPTRVEVFQKS